MGFRNIYSTENQDIIFLTDFYSYDTIYKCKL